MTTRSPHRPRRRPPVRLIGALLLAAASAHPALAQRVAEPAALPAWAASATPAASAPAPLQPGPHQWIDELDLSLRRRLQAPDLGTPDAAEQDTAARITALIGSAPGAASLTQTDLRGRTPLMRAAASGHARVVDALLADAGVRRTINQATPQGETALMLANFAPSLSLVACQPGTLTLDRAALLPPYVLRMRHVLRDRGQVLLQLRAALLQAGAVQDLPSLRDAWRARCPHSTPALQAALAASDDLLLTLTEHAVAAQSNFNEQAGAAAANLPASPPAGLRFLRPQERSASRDHSLIAGMPVRAGMVCRRMARPDRPRTPPGWRGTVVLRAHVATRAGLVEAVDIDRVGPAQDGDGPVAQQFERAVVQALAHYECLGDHVFQQEFQFAMR